MISLQEHFWTQNWTVVSIFGKHKSWTYSSVTKIAKPLESGKWTDQ